MSTVADLSETLAGAAERVGPSVVGLGRGWGLRSGVVIAEGRVLTNAHNLRRAEVAVTFADGRRDSSEAAGVDPDLDLAVLATDTGDAPVIAWEPEPLPPSLGTRVVALANPGGRVLRVTLGFVSSEGRSFRGPRGRRVEGAIEHTAVLPRGSSGGPLVDVEGRLLGLNSVRMDGGLILAVPATASVRKLAEDGSPSPHRLGVAVGPPRVAKRLRRAVGLPERDGLLVRDVESDSVAARAGVERGDLIADLDIDALYSALDSVPQEGGSLPLTVLRGTDEREVEVAFP